MLLFGGRMKRLVITLCLALSLAPPVLSYDEITGIDSGTIAGKVTISGGKPTPKGFNLITFFVVEAPKGRRSAHEIEERPHVGLEALGRAANIKPTLELQNP